MTDTKRPLRVFLCHATADKPVVTKLYESLVKDGVDAWLDSQKLLPGKNWPIEIPKAVRDSDVVIVCISSNSTTKEGFVQREIKIALDAAEEKLDENIFIIPARLDECSVPQRLSNYQWVDLFSNGGYDLLFKSLQLRASNNESIKPIEPSLLFQERKFEAKVRRHIPIWVIVAVFIIAITITGFFSYTMGQNNSKQMLTKEAQMSTEVQQIIVPNPMVTDVEESNLPTSTSMAIVTAAGPTKVPSTNEPVKPSQSVGTLLIKVPSRCSPYYHLKVGDQDKSYGSLSGTMQVIEGTYDLTLRGDFGTEFVKKGIVIKANKETMVDVNDMFGVFMLSPYDNLKESLAYTFVGQNDSSSPFNRDYAEYICGTPGEYTVELTNAVRVANILDILNYYAAPRILTNDQITFTVEIKAGETIISKPDTWTQQLGLLSFTPDDSFKAFNMKAYKLEGGVQTEIKTYYGYELPFNAGERYWMVPGKYRIELTKEIVGLSYDFEIKAGEETILELPSSP